MHTHYYNYIHPISQTIGGLFGTFAFGIIASIVAMIIIVKMRQRRSGTFDQFSYLANYVSNKSSLFFTLKFSFL